jgi:hypothetical protein
LQAPHDAEAPEATVLTSATRPVDVPQFGRRRSERLPFAALPVVDKVRAVCVVLENVMVVDGLFDELTGGYGGVDGCRGRVRLYEKWLSVKLADESLADLDARVRSDHLKVEDEPACPHRVDHVAQDVHDVLRLYSSQGPREDYEVERVRLDLDRVAGRNTIGNPLGEPCRKAAPCFVNRFGIRIEREHIRRVGSDTDCEATVSAAQLEDALSTEVGQSVKRSEMRAFRIEEALYHVAHSSASAAG